MPTTVLAALPHCSLPLLCSCSPLQDSQRSTCLWRQRPWRPSIWIQTDLNYRIPTDPSPPLEPGLNTDKYGTYKGNRSTREETQHQMGAARLLVCLLSNAALSCSFSCTHTHTYTHTHTHARTHTHTHT